MIELPNVTLIAVDTSDDTSETEFAIDCSTKHIQFGAVKLLGKDQLPFRNDYQKYNLFMLYQLKDYFDTDFVLTVQQDGHVINPLAWEAHFLEYDFIGGPWIEDVCGNGGFSLRSKRFCEEVSKIPPHYFPFFQEDANICKHARFGLTDRGYKFAPVDVASRFSYAKNTKWNVYKGSFGFHGTHSLLREHPNRLECAECQDGTCTHLECSACDLKKLTITKF